LVSLLAKLEKFRNFLSQNFENAKGTFSLKLKQRLSQVKYRTVRGIAKALRLNVFPSDTAKERASCRQRNGNPFKGLVNPLCGIMRLV
jgi:hypothetical protein